MTSPEIYDALGFDTIPLKAGEKKPIPASWQSRTSRSLWRNAPADANIAIRSGGLAKVAVIDCDEPRTFDNATAWLANHGIMDYPTVQSASGVGRHIYVNFTGGLTGNYRKFTPDFGGGEFRYGPGSYTVAPPSMVEGAIYTVLQGRFERLPSLTLADVLPILSDKENKPITDAPNVPRLAMSILKGNTPERYKSRSEAEQAAIGSLVNVGFTYGQVLSLFNHYKPGKYAELYKEDPHNAERWLSVSYDNALQWAKTNESEARQIAKNAINWAMSSPWLGRSGTFDRNAFIAVSRIAYNAGRLEVSAACRDVAEAAKMDKVTASHALRRLVSKYKFLEVVAPAVGECATIYRVAKPIHSHIPPVRECTTFATHDAFRKGRGKAGLPPSAGQVYDALQAGPLAVDELAQATGRDKRTVQAVLGRMATIVDRTTGEVLSMVERDGGKWKALPVDLEQIADLVGTSGATERQKINHEKERRAHARDLRKGKQNEKTNNSR
jgi:hypothetical protein